MRIALCNEVLREMEFTSQCSYAAGLGYDGLEVAPFTLAENPHLISSLGRSEFRRMAEDAGIQITGLHWLLLAPEGMSITAKDSSIRDKTLDFMRRLVVLCADLGGEVLVHGSPKQRVLEAHEDRVEAEKWAQDMFAVVAEEAEQAGVVYCVEALNQAETNFINHISEAVALVQQIGSPALRTMLDTKAALLQEKEPIPVLLDRWIPDGMIAHIHVNESNLRAPGQGENHYTPIFSALIRNSYKGLVGVEPFEYFPDGKGAAARAIGYIQGILESLEN